MNLSGAEIELVELEDKEYILKKITDKLRRRYDYIIMDCPPSLSMLTINALTAATSVLVPIQCEYYALEGLSQLIHTIELVRDRLNKRLKIEGVVFTMYDARTNLSLQVVENVKENLDQNIYKTIIPRNVRLAEAPSYGKPINLYDSRSTGAESYRLLADLAMTSKFRLRFNKEKNLMKQRKTHHIYNCPGCGQKIRIPKGKGKIEIDCPKCHTKFVKRS